MARLPLGVGLAVLGLAWGPVPHLLAGLPFTAHMTAHILVVAVAAPLVAWGLAETRLDPVRLGPATLLSPIPASMVELVAVWAWHAPALHEAARLSTAAFLAEQATFLAAGLLLWAAILGGRPEARAARHLAGTAALVFTSIHMTLLGALFALAPRAFYAHEDGHAGAQPLFDLQLGGAVMLVVGGAAYLLGGLVLLAQLARGTPARRVQARTAPACDPPVRDARTMLNGADPGAGAERRTRAAHG